jgi:hypothetical protein
MDETRLQRLQALLQRYELPAWLLCDFRHSNPIAYQVLGLDPTLHCTRRWAVLIPAQGQPEKLLHRVEPHVLQDVPARERLYATYGEWQRVLHEWVQRYRRLALEYSPRGELPTISLVDGGTVELLRFFGAELHSSADLVQELLAVHSEQQLRQLAETTQQLRVLVWEGVRLDWRAASPWGITAGVRCAAAPAATAAAARVGDRPSPHRCAHRAGSQSALRPHSAGYGADSAGRPGTH